jgi:hypothetical protein
MNARILGSFLAVLVLGACSGEQKIDMPELGEVMPIIPLPPSSRLIGRVGSDEALQLTFLSTLSQEDMAALYRGTFTDATWTFISDAKSPDGAIVLYVENDGIPLWVRITRTSGAPGSTVVLSGALVTRDSELVDSLAGSADSQ